MSKQLVFICVALIVCISLAYAVQSNGQKGTCQYKPNIKPKAGDGIGNKCNLQSECSGLQPRQGLYCKSYYGNCDFKPNTPKIGGIDDGVGWACNDAHPCWNTALFCKYPPIP